jgi:precorrin-6B methylase 2
MRIKLTTGEIAELKRRVDRSTGPGGFQNLLRHLWYHLDDDTGELVLNEVLLERIYRYAFQYDNSGWRRTLRKIFRRTLGANLDRGLKWQSD